MKELHIILLEQAIGAEVAEDITVYIGRYKSRNECLMKMHLQGILPTYKVLTHSTLSSRKALPRILFPTLEVIQVQLGGLNAETLFSYYIARPLKKLFKGSVRKQWQQLGEFDTLTKRVYPIPEQPAKEVKK